MGSTASPKVKTTDEEGLGVCFLACNTLEVEGPIGAPRWD